MVLDQSYDLSGTSPRLVSESHSMDMATFTYQDGGYQPVSYRTPEHGGWESDPNDLSTFVPDPAVSAAANLPQYYPEQSQQCYEAAVQYQRSIAPPDQLLIAGGQRLPAPRYDGDGWCIYVPDGYKRAEEGSNAHWVSSYDTGAQLRIEKSDWSAYSLSRQLIFNGWQLMDQKPLYLKTGTTESALYPARDGGCWQVTLTGGSRFEDTPYASDPERELAELRQIALSFIVR